MNKLLVIPILACLLIIIDYYAYIALKVFFSNRLVKLQKVFNAFYIFITLFSLSGLFIYHFSDRGFLGDLERVYLMSFLFISYFSKGIVAVIIWFGELVRGMAKFFKHYILKDKTEKKLIDPKGKKLSRANFIKKTAVVTAAIPFTTLSFGIVNGVHNYRVIHKKITLPKLPKSFHGIKIAQISDLHSGSFFNKMAVRGGVDLLVNQRPDLVFFTGDLVNNETKEVDQYIDVFNKIKAPLGVYSTLGNHDYGNYRRWASDTAKSRNLLDMYKAHELLGWRLLNNKNHILEQAGDQLAIIGVENWGTGRFPRYGRLSEAMTGSEQAPVKLLLSHDPSHWDAEIRPMFPDIDITFAGHTHGFQFGIEIPHVKWSPSQYLYKQWADLYVEDHQYLYVNRGFGFIGFPGRVGIEPEITIFELNVY